MSDLHLFLKPSGRSQRHGSRAKQLTSSKVETFRESHDLSATSMRLWYRVADRFCKNITYHLRKAHIEQSFKPSKNLQKC